MLIRLFVLQGIIGVSRVANEQCSWPSVCAFCKEVCIVICNTFESGAPFICLMLFEPEYYINNKVFVKMYGFHIILVLVRDKPTNGFKLCCKVSTWNG